MGVSGNVSAALILTPLRTAVSVASCVNAVRDPGFRVWRSKREILFGRLEFKSFWTTRPNTHNAHPSRPAVTQAYEKWQPCRRTYRACIGMKPKAVISHYPQSLQYIPDPGQHRRERLLYLPQASRMEMQVFQTLIRFWVIVT